MQPTNPLENPSSSYYMPASAAASPSIDSRICQTVTLSNFEPHFISQSTLFSNNNFYNSPQITNIENYNEAERHHQLGIFYFQLYLESKQPEHIEKAFFHWETAELMGDLGAPLLAAIELLLNSHLRKEPYSGKIHEELLNHWYSSTLSDLKSNSVFEFLLKEHTIETAELCEYMDSLASELNLNPNHSLTILKSNIVALNRLCIYKIVSLDLPEQSKSIQDEGEKRKLWNDAKALYLMISLALLMTHPEGLVKLSSERRTKLVKTPTTPEVEEFMTLITRIEKTSMSPLLSYGDNVIKDTLLIIGAMFSREKYRLFSQINASYRTS